MTGVVKEFPVVNRFPTESYHCMFPAEAVAAKVTVPESQTDAGEVEIIVGGVFIVAMISVLGTFGQFPFVAST